MLNAIVGIGKVLLERESKIDTLVKKQQFDEIVRVVFDLDKKEIVFSSETFDEGKLKKYLWIGNNPGNIPQTRLTTDNLWKLFSESIYNIYCGLDDCSLKQIIEEIINTFSSSSDFGTIIDPLKISDFEQIVKEMPEKLETKEQGAKQKVDPRVDAYVKGKYGKKKRILFTTVVRKNGQEIALAECDDYRNFLLNELEEKSFEDTIDGTCYACGRHGKVTYKFKTLTMKIFINDKINFASGLNDEGFVRNYTLCPKCYDAFSAGERLILDNLQSRLGECPVYVIPEFYNQLKTSDSKELLNIIKDIDRIIKALNKYESWKQFRDRLRRTFDEPFLLNFLFAEKSNAAFKIKKLIPDVNPSRLKYLFEKLEFISSEFSNTFQNLTFNIDFETIFVLIPVRKQLFNEIYNIYESLLTGKLLNERWIVSKLLEALKVRYFETYGPYYTFSRSYQFEHMVLLSNAFHTYLKELGVLKGVNGKMDDILERLRAIDEDLADYVAKAEYDEQKVSLFLAGVLVAEIAKNQWKADKRKQILNLINFNGMPLQKVKMFVTQLFAKLRQYDSLNSYTEKVVGTCKEYLDQAEKKWTLSPQENVYYILSGYAYKTKKYITSGEGGNEDE
jgi:CRISPR-associated protein Csh1